MFLTLIQPMVLSCEPWLLAGQRLRPPVHEQCFMRWPWGKREIIRYLKRFVAREIFGYLCRAPGAACPEQITA